MPQSTTGEPTRIKNSLKAGLLSGLVCPGVGNIVLNAYVRGSIYVALSLILLVLLLSAIVPVVKDFVTTEFESISALPDLFDVSGRLFEIIMNTRQIIGLLIAFTVLWLVALIDAVSA